MRHSAFDRVATHTRYDRVRTLLLQLCHIVYADGTARDIAKMPKSDTAKTSLPGILAVTPTAVSFLRVFGTVLDIAELLLGAMTQACPGKHEGC